MTTLADVVREICEAGPELESTRLLITQDWEPDEPPPTILLAALARSSVGPKLDDRTLGRVASIVESALRDGTQATKDAVATGFVEAAVIASKASTNPARLLSHFGPAAREYCRAWDAATGGHTEFDAEDDPDRG